MTHLNELTALTTPTIDDIFHVMNDPAGAATDQKITASNLRAFMSNVFNVLDYGAIGDGSTDDYTAVFGAITAAQAVGGTVYFPANTYRINSQILLPNDGGAIPKQRPVKFLGAGALFTGQTIPPYGGTILDLRYAGSGAKIETYGLGLFEITGLTLTDYGTSSNAFLKTTNTTIMPHDLAFVGNPTKSHATCDQDAIILGGTALVIDGTTDSPFQGYGTVIERCYFARIRRGVMFQTYANAVVVRDNTWWNTCGGDATAAAIDMLGDVTNYCTGNLIAGNLIETVAYVYGIKAELSTGCSFIGNNFFDPGSSMVAYFRLEATAIYNLIIAGYSDDTTPLISDAGAGTNTVIQAHQSQTSTFPQLVAFMNNVSFANTLSLNATAAIRIQPTAAAGNTALLIQALRSAAEGANPGTEIFAVQSDGRLALAGDNAGIIKVSNQAGVQIAGFSTGLRAWFASGAGADMSQNSGSGGSYLTLQNYGIKVKDHTGAEQLRLGAGIDGLKFGAALDTNLYRSAADTLKTDDKLIAGAGIVTNAGASASRPASPTAGQMYFDTTLGKPIWYSGAAWVDATGAGV